MSSIMGDYDARILKLHETLDILIEQYDRLPDAAYQVFSVEAEIRSFELRKDRLNLTVSHVMCNLCKQKILEGDEPVRLGERRSYLICPRCIRTINQVKGTTELEKQIGIKSPGVLKQDCEGPLKPLQSEGLVRKSGKCWLVHEVVDDLFYKAGRRKENLLHSWIDELEIRLQILKEQNQFFEEYRSQIPEVTSQLFSLQFQIQDLEAKLNRIRGGKLPFRCSQCGAWLKEEGTPTFFVMYTICNNCKDVVRNVMSTSEAEEKYGLSKGRIRVDNSLGHLNKYKKNGLFRLSGKIWLIHDVAVLDKYKELKAENNSNGQSNSIPSDLAQRSASIFNRVMESKRIE